MINLKRVSPSSIIKKRGVTILKKENLKTLIIEMMIVLSPLALAFLATGFWLSGITHNNIIDGTSARLSGNVWIAFDYWLEDTVLGYTAYNFDILQVFCVLVVSTFVLILVGRLIYLFITNRRTKIKKGV